MTDQKPPKRWKRWLRRGLFALLILLIAALIVHQVWNYRAGKALQRELDAIRAAGDPLTLDELWPPEIEPASENAAYLYQAAFNLFEKCGLDQFQRSLDEVAALFDPASWSEEATATVREMVATCAEPLELLRRAAHMDRCRFAPDPDSPGLVVSEHLSNMRQAGRLLHWSGSLRLREGDADGALQEARTAFLLSQALANEPVNVSFMVRLALINSSLRGTETVLNEHQPAREISRAFLEDVTAVSDTLRPDLSLAFKGERVMGMRNLQMPLSKMGLRGWLARPVLRTIQTGVLREMGPIVALAEMPRLEARAEMDRLEAEFERFKAELDSDERQRIINAGVILGKMLGPSFFRLKEDETKTESRIALAQVAMALKLYKGAHGHYPESLSSLSPEFLSELPSDPFTGEALQYARDGEGFLLYSIGLNGFDDGGLAETEEDGKKVDPDTDDIAWRCAR